MRKLIIATILFLITNQINSQTKIIAHRGFSSIAPENTLIAFSKAIESKADYFELDVHQAKDGSLIVIHDYSVDRTSSNNKKGIIAKMNTDDLAQVKVGFSLNFDDTYENEKIPTLREALELAKGKIKVCIEIKVFGIEKEVLDIIYDLGVSDDIILFAFDYPVLAKIRQLDKNIPILYLIDFANEDTIDYATLIGSNAIGVGSNTHLTKEYIDFAHKHNIEVWKWTINNVDEMQRLIDLGLDGLITNFPEKAIGLR